MYYWGGGAVMVHRPASYRVWGEGRARAPTFDPHTIKRMQVPLSPYSPISVLLRQPLSIKKSYAGAIHIGIYMRILYYIILYYIILYYIILYVHGWYIKIPMYLLFIWALYLWF